MNNSKGYVSEFAWEKVAFDGQIQQQWTFRAGNLSVIYNILID